MNTRNLLCVVAMFSVVACKKSDSTPVDTSLSLNGATTVPLDTVGAAERARTAALAAPVAAAPVAVAPAASAPVRSRAAVRHTSSSARASEPVYSSGATASAPTHTVKNTKRDAVIGGVAGAAVGAVTGGGVKGAVIGGAAGAVLGGVIGNNVDVKKKH